MCSVFAVVTCDAVGEAMGGAVYCNAGPAVVAGGVFRNNTAVVDGAGKAYGGAVYGTVSAQVSDGALFESNSAAGGSSGQSGATVLLSNATVCDDCVR